MRTARLLLLAAAFAVAFVATASAARHEGHPPHVFVKTLPAYGVNEYSAVLNSRINPHGSTATYRFQWGRTKQYGHIAPEYSPEEPVYPGHQGYEIEEIIEDLRPGTVYHFRAVAYSHGHKFFGQDETLRTWRYHPEPPSARVAGRARTIKKVFSRAFPQYHQGSSVALAPDGTPWFGLESEESPPELANVESRRLSPVPVSTSGRYGLTTALDFDQAGNLWFGMSSDTGVEIARRAPDGAVDEIKLPGAEPVRSIAIGPDGRVWFTRATYGGGAKVGWIGPTGTPTEIDLAPESGPSSIAIGPDGAAWFTEEAAGQIGRVATGGEVRLYPAGAGVEPRQIVVGPDGALWFSENGEPGPKRTSHDRIGRITTDGAITQFPIPYGDGTVALAVDPRGFIWFSTEVGEIASIAPSGGLGGRGCLSVCGTSLVSLAPTPNGSLWFATGSASCKGCGGSASLMTQIAGTTVGKIPPGALRLPR